MFFGCQSRDQDRPHIASSGIFTSSFNSSSSKDISASSSLGNSMISQSSYPAVSHIPVSSSQSSSSSHLSSSVASSTSTPKKGIAVLMYHDIMSSAQKNNSINKAARENTLVVTTEEFDRQMKILSDAGYTALDLKSLQDYVAGKKSYTKAVVITFDDGYRQNGYLAAPILQKYGYRATVFVITSKLDLPEDPVNLSSYAIQFFHADELNNFTYALDYASHTDNMHDDYKGEPMLMSKDDASILADLKLSRQKLNDTTFFAYPFGKYNDNDIKLLKEAGFTMAFTTKSGITTTDTDPFKVPRYEIQSGLSDSRFKTIVGIK